jgi:hypothetical protein
MMKLKLHHHFHFTKHSPRNPSKNNTKTHCEMDPFDAAM